MTYNYDRSYLRRHSALVARLVQAWNTGEELTSSYNDTRELRNHKNLIRSLLANLAHNSKDFASIRSDMLTWTTFSEDRWHLHVGRERPADAKGGKPASEPQFAATQQVAVAKDASGAVRWQEPITSQKAAFTFIDHLMKEDAKEYPTQAFKVEFKGPLDVFTETCAIQGYVVSELDPPYLLVTRKKL